jgi:hypothetical protein
MLQQEDMLSLTTIAKYGPQCISHALGFHKLKAIARRNLEAAVAELAVSGYLRAWVHDLPEIGLIGRQDIFMLLAREELTSLDIMIRCNGPVAIVASEGFARLGAVAKMCLEAALETFMTNQLSLDAVSELSVAAALVKAKKEGLVNHRLDERCQDDLTPILTAAKNGNTLGVALLIQAKADVHERTAKGYTALKIAVEKGHDDTAAFVVSIAGESMLRQSEALKNARRAKLFSHSIEERVGSCKETPLMLAILDGREESVAMLLEADADVFARNHVGVLCVCVYVCMYICVCVSVCRD